MRAEVPAEVVALVPVNRLDRAKRRLAGLLSPAEREALTTATLLTVLDALAGAGIPAFVLTADQRAATIATPSASVIPEDAERSGLNGQLEGALARLRSDCPGASVLVLHADLPLADGAAIAVLLAAAPPPPSATLVRSGDGGTNALLLNPPGHFPLAYGPDSAGRHALAARAAGLRVVMVDEPRLALDLDTPADIAKLLGMPGGPASRAGRVLLDHGIPVRLRR